MRVGWWWIKEDCKFSIYYFISFLHFKYYPNFKNPIYNLWAELCDNKGNLNDFHSFKKYILNVSFKIEYTKFGFLKSYIFFCQCLIRADLPLYRLAPIGRNATHLSLSSQTFSHFGYLGKLEKCLLGILVKVWIFMGNWVVFFQLKIIS